MKIVFICGSLEPGRDGVGDYVFQLSNELLKQKHVVAIIAFNDKFVSAFLDNTSNSERQISVIRYPAASVVSLRISTLKNWLQEHKTDYISLQFVPYAFHPKGLPFFLGRKLHKISAGAKWHIMFHELWVHVNKDSTLKTRLLAALQKYLVHNLIKRLKPCCITTSIPLYKQMLSDELVSILPLFSNISFYKKEDENSKDDTVLKVIYFGSFSSAIDEFKVQLQFLKSAGEHSQRRINFTIAGEGGAFKRQSIELAESLFGKENVTELGRLTEEELSLYFQNADVGVSRANIELAGKSGSTLAMLEHGLPVLLRGTQPDDVLNSGVAYFGAQLIFPDSGYDSLIQKRAPVSRLTEVAQQFIGYLNEYC